MGDYMPTQDAALVTWMQNFAYQLSSDPARFGQAAADAAQVQAVVDAAHAAFLVTSHPNTRNAGTIALRDQKIAEATSLIRQYAMLIKMNAGVSIQDKIDIGVRPINPTREPIPAPATSPVLNIVGATPGSQTVRYADSMDPESRKKPFGVTQFQLFRVIAAEAIEGPPAAGVEFYGAYTRNPIGVEFDEADDGKVVTYYGRWSTTKGLVGPFSNPVSMRIAA